MTGAALEASVNEVLDLFDIKPTGPIQRPAFDGMKQRRRPRPRGGSRPRRLSRLF